MSGLVQLWLWREPLASGGYAMRLRVQSAADSAPDDSAQRIGEPVPERDAEDLIRSARATVAAQFDCDVTVERDA